MTGQKLFAAARVFTLCFVFLGFGWYLHLDRKIWLQLSYNKANPLTDLDFLCSIMRPAAGTSVANMGNQ